MWTDIGRHTLQTSLTSWLLLAREAQAMQGQLLPCQANLDVLRITQAKPLPVKARGKIDVGRYAESLLCS